MWLGNLIGWFMGLLYGARWFRNEALTPDLDVRIYSVQRMIPKWAAGQTWGNKVFLRPKYLSDELIKHHEGIHVKQWKRLGLLFLPAYVWYTIVAGIKYGPKRAYRMNKLEREAYGDFN